MMMTMMPTWQCDSLSDATGCVSKKTTLSGHHHRHHHRDHVSTDSKCQQDVKERCQTMMSNV
jgi:hypothetical protein